MQLFEARQEAGEVNFRHVDHDRRVQHIVADRIIFPTDRNLGSFTRLRKMRTWISPLRVFTGGPGAARPSEFH